MNQTVIENRKKISSACASCFTALEKYAEACNAFKAEKERISTLLYIEEEKERMVNKAAENLRTAAEAQYTEISRNLEDIKAASEEMAGILDIGEEFQNTLSVIKTIGHDLPVEARFSLVSPFKGQKQVLEILQAAYSAAGLDTEPYFKGLIFDPKSRMDGLAESAYRIVLQPSDSLLSAAAFARSLEAFADDTGAELPSRFNDLTDLSSIYMDAVYAAAGITPAK